MFKTINELIAACQKDPPLRAEFLASRKRLIELVNEGKVPLKIRAGKRDAPAKELTDARAKALKLIESSKTQKVLGYSGMTKKRYQETHGQRTPEEDGLDVFWDTHNGVLQECCLVAKQHKDEWDCNVIDEKGVEKQTVIDDGSAIVRAGQIEDKFKALAKTHQNAKYMCVGEVEKKRGCRSSTSSSTCSGNSSGSGSESNGEDSDDDDHASCAESAGSEELIGSLCTPQKKKQISAETSGPQAKSKKAVKNAGKSAAAKVACRSSPSGSKASPSNPSPKVSKGEERKKEGTGKDKKRTHEDLVKDDFDAQLYLSRTAHVNTHIGL